MKYIKKDIILVISFFLVMTLLLTTILNKIIFETKVPIYNDTQYWKASDNLILKREFIPNSSFYLDGINVRLDAMLININTEGFRDKEHSILKEPNKYRILMSGDSFTFGWTINQSNIFPSLVEKRLNSNKKNFYEFEVFNLGIPGYDLIRKVEMIKYKGLKYSPNLIIVQIIEDDIFDYDLIGNITKKILIEREYRGYKNYSDYSQKEKYELSEEVFKEFQSKYDFNNDSYLYDVINRPLIKLNNITKNNNNMKIILMVFPPFSQSFYNRLANISKEYSWYILNLNPIYEKYGESQLVVHKKDDHPNKLAHDLISNEIISFIEQNNIIQNESN